MKVTRRSEVLEEQLRAVVCVREDLYGLYVETAAEDLCREAFSDLLIAVFYLERELRELLDKMVKWGR